MVNESQQCEDDRILHRNDANWVLNSLILPDLYEDFN